MPDIVRDLFFLFWLGVAIGASALAFRLDESSRGSPRSRKDGEEVESTKMKVERRIAPE